MATLKRTRRAVTVLPFYNLTLERWSMFEGRKCKQNATAEECAAEALDCTHFCSTPTLWAKVVSDLYAVLDAHW